LTRSTFVRYPKASHDRALHLQFLRHDFKLPRSLPLTILLTALTVLTLAGCSQPTSRYLRLEDSLRTGNPQAADAIVAAAEHEYGSRNRILYWMDRGMTLHLAGRYEASTGLLEQADDELERLYTRRLRSEAKAFLISDNELPYEGDPHEHVMINALKALNYAMLSNWTEALVEARKLDHRLNVLSDRTGNQNAYREDAFARYLSGILYETTGDLNNAFIAYRKSYDEYRAAHPWSHVPLPSSLRADLLRMTEALHLADEHDEFRKTMSEISWQPVAETQPLAHVVVISYNGRAPRKEDQFIDLPISLDALNLVLMTKATMGTRTSDARAVESVLYGLNGHVVRVALPRLISQKTQVASGDLTLSGETGTFSARTELVQNFTVLAEKNLADRFKATTVKAVARATVKYALAEGIGRGAHAAVGKDAGPLVGLLIGSLAKALAVASEESDKRSWRTLPDEIQIARLWVPPGSYELRLRPIGRASGSAGPELIRTITVKAGETTFVTERILN
jgi:hypothetical protein